MAQAVRGTTFQERRFAVQESFDAASHQHLAPAAVQFNTLGATSLPHRRQPALQFIDQR